MFAWLKARREKAELTRRSLAMNSDQSLIAEQVPELGGMSEVDGMAHSFRALDVCLPVPTLRHSASDELRP